MNKIGIYDFLDFEYHYLEFIKRTSTFIHVNSSNFLILDSENNTISYQYRHNTQKEYSMGDLKPLLKSRTWNESLSGVHYTFPRTLGEADHQMVLKVENPIDRRKTLAVTVLEFKNPDGAALMDSEFNAHYYQQLCYHTETICTNYEKLYYLIDVFTELLAAKDCFMPYHMTNVANLALSMSLEMDITEEERMVLYFAALLHDIGKLSVPDAIIVKPDKLTDDEFDRIMMHPRKGAEIVSAVTRGMTLLKNVPKVILHHHENYDGSGYPIGLTGNKIPYLSRVLRVADSIDAMLSRRSYKDELSMDKVIDELTNNSTTMYDPQIADIGKFVLSEKYSDLIKADIFEESFMANVSLSFHYMDSDNLISLNGNLLLKGESIVFLRHDNTSQFFSVNAISRASLSYLKHNDFTEYFVEISDVQKETFHLTSVKRIPTDKMFSMVWKGTLRLFCDGKYNSDVAYMKLGGNSIVFAMTDVQHNALQVSENKNLAVDIQEKIEEVGFKKQVPIAVIKVYKAMTGWIYVGKLLNLTPGERDRLLRLLFRVQVLNRKNINRCQT